jgi:hypothetical protein
MFPEQTAPAHRSIPDSTGSSFFPASSVQDPDPAHAASSEASAEPREWIIQRCTQRWIGTELQYEDYPVPEDAMTRAQAESVLERVDREDRSSEFRAHRIRLGDHVVVLSANLADVPGVGGVPVGAAGQPFLTIDIEELKEFGRQEKQREGLTVQLLFAARDLAGRVIRAVELPRTDPATPVAMVYECKECRRSAYLDPFAIRHARKCPAGRVMLIRADFDRLFPSHGQPEPVVPKAPRSKDPEPATRPCGKCRKTDGAWLTERKTRDQAREIQPNQCVSLETTDGFLIVHTHLCDEAESEPGGAA